MRHFLNKMVASIFLSILIICLSSCSKTKVVDNSLNKVLDSGKLILGLDGAFPPMGFIDKNGEIAGFDIEVAKEVCNRLDIELVLKVIDWNEKEKELNSGTIDCIWNGLSVTNERKETMLLSKSYMKNELIYVVPGNSSIKTTNEVVNYSVGVQSGSTADDYVHNDKFKETSIKYYKTAESLLIDLEKNYIDVALVDSVVAFYFIFSSSDTYYILSDSVNEEEYAIGFRKNDYALCNKIEEIMSEMKADGTLAKISKKWFGSDITIIK